MANNEDWASGRVALVTGATSGIGAACVHRLIGGGAHVIAIGRRQERLDAMATKLKTDQLFIKTLDVCEKEAAADLLESLPDAFKPIDMLINNAGLALGTGPAQNADLEHWETMINTNITGLVRMTHALLPAMSKGARGDIINISSVAANYAYPGGNVYGGTKAFVRQFSLNLKTDLLGTNVRVTSVEPGMVETEFSVVRFKDQDKADSVYANMQPLTADNIAETIESILRLPAHVNINTIEIMPVQQAFAGFSVKRD